MNQQEFIRLLDKYLEGTATEAEQALLVEYYKSQQATNEWEEHLLGNSTQTGNRIWGRLEASMAESTPAPIVSFYRHRGLQIAAAALVLLFAGIATWYGIDKVEPELAVKTEPKTAIPSQNNIHQATLTLGDGTTILLDGAANGVLAMQGNTVVKKWGRKLIYEPVTRPITTAKETVMYNRIATAKGVQYQIVLPDGSNAWLNAASAMRFAAGGAQAVRRVEVEGEVYFEIAKNEARAFQVAVPHFAASSKSAVVEALGTNFNINAYGDEPDMRTTLLEGSLKVSAAGVGSGAQLLAPGEQALLQRDSAIQIKKVDVARIMAWQKGLFDFEGANTREVMRQITRWYDVEVAYKQSNNDKRFSGRLSRAMALSDVLKILEQSGVRFEIEGKKITVLS